MGELNDYSGTAGSNNAEAPNGWKEGILAGSLNNSDREFAARVKRWYADNNGSLATAGTSTAITITLNAQHSAWFDGLSFYSRITTTCGATPTINPTGSGALGAKSLYWPDGTQLGSGDIVAGGVYGFYYELTSDKVFVIGSKPSAVGPASSTDNALARFDGTTGKLLQNSAVVVADAGDVTVTSTDAGVSGPQLILYHNSATPAANDGVGYVTFNGEDSAGNTDTYAKVFGEIVDTTSTSEDGRFAIQTVIAGALASRAYFGGGLYMAGALTDQGAGTVNATNFYRSGTELVRRGTTLTKNPTTADSVTTGAHGLGATPNMIVAYLECISADNGYTAGDRIFFASGRTAASTDAGLEFAADATNAIIVIGNGISTVDKGTLNVEALDLTKWKAEIVPYLLG
jgi:hypothetical protein